MNHTVCCTQIRCATICGLVLATAAVLGLCSCSSIAPRKPPVGTHPSTRTNWARVPAVQPRSDALVRRSTRARNREASRIATTLNPSPDAPTGAIVPLSNSTEVSAPVHFASASSPTYAELPYDAFYGTPVGQDEPWSPPGIQQPWPRDEYLFDGGDRDIPVNVGGNFSVSGLEMEDTVGHFDTLDGRTIVTPSNRVPIYAPRFAAVRKVDGLAAHQGRERSAGFEVPELLDLKADVQIATTTLQQVQPEGQLGTKRLTTLRERNRSISIENRQGVLGLHDGFLPYEDFRIIRHGQYDNTEKARLAHRIEAALVWEHKDAVLVLIDGQQAVLQRGSSRPEEALRYERPPGKPQLRVIKVASQGEAHPGEIIDFTIRFDNISNELIGNVTIIDNLTPRLQYVADSAQCSLKADFFTQENEGESLVLRWEIIDPLEAGQGGVIRFQCRVR